MLDVNVINEFVLEFFSSVSTSKNGTHWHARCPLCGDSKTNSRKKRFHLDYGNGNPMWQCFNCGRTGSFLPLYMELKGLSSDEAKQELFGFDTIKERLTNREKFLNIVQKKNRINYEDFNWIRKQSISRFEEADGHLVAKYKEILNKFIEDRKIPDDYDILICYEGDFKGRIIVPVVDGDNNIIYFQARRLPGSDIEPKYKNPTIEKSTIILNEHKFVKDKHIIVTEGLIDAFMIGDQGTSCLGGYFTEELLDVLYSYTNKPLIVAFDNPFIDKAGYNNMIRFMEGTDKKVPNRFARYVKYFLPEKKHRDSKDINILRVNHNIGDVYEYIVKNSYSMTRACLKLKLERRK